MWYAVVFHRTFKTATQTLAELKSAELKNVMRNKSAVGLRAAGFLNADLGRNAFAASL